MANFRESYPIDFDLYDKDAQNVLYIEDTSDQLLTLQVKNAATKTIQLIDLAAPVSNSNYHFALRFRPGTLSPVSLSSPSGGIQLTVDTALSWEMTPPETDTAGMDVIYLRSTTPNLSLDPGTLQTLVFEHVGADAGQGARGTRVTLEYRNIAFSDAPELEINGNREIHLSVINHRGKQDIPLHIGFVGDNGVLNDGATGNDLTIRFSNTMEYDVANPDISSLTFLHDADETLRSKIILSFDAGTANEEWALGTETELRSITISQPAGWALTEPVQGESPEWIVYPATDNQVLYGRNAPAPNPGYFDLEISNIISAFPTGYTYLHIRYENIPGYWDGQLKVAIQKRPLVYNGNNVGIRTTSPRGKLDVDGPGNIYLVDDPNTNGYQSIFIPGHIYITPHNGGDLTYIQARREDNSGFTNMRFRTYNDGELVEAMHIASNGNVGIGNNSPATRLEVAGGQFSVYGSGLDGSNLQKFVLYSDTAKGLYFDAPKDALGDKLPIQFNWRGGGTPPFYIDGNSKVGIGTTSPQAKLEVIGSGNRTVSTYNYMASGTRTVVTDVNFPAGLVIVDNYCPNFGYNPVQHQGYSIYASERIACSQLDVHCDERIKKDTVWSNTQEDLEKLLKIQITDYVHIDPLVHGSKPQKKVLGQQLAAVYPQAVSIRKGVVVPDIMKHAASDTNGEITLKNHGLKTGEKVQILYRENGEDKTEVFSIQEVKANRFRVEIPAVEQLFVYGREVDDFHLVDFDALSALNISATQELHKRMEALTVENERSNATIAKQDRLIKELLNRMEQLEERLAGS